MCRMGYIRRHCCCVSCWRRQAYVASGMLVHDHQQLQRLRTRQLSWIIRRMVRDFEHWMDAGIPGAPIKIRLREMLDEMWELEKASGEKVSRVSRSDVPRPSQYGLCV